MSWLKRFFKSLDVNRLMALTALFVSVLTLIIFVRQTNIMDEQSRHSIMPYVLIEYDTNEPDTLITIRLVNHGVGPAIISRRAFYYQGETYDQEFRDFLSDQIPEMDGIRILSSSTFTTGTAIPAGGSRLIIAVGGDMDSYLAFRSLMDGLLSGSDFNYDLRYESVYGDTWMLHGGSQKPVKLEGD